MKNVLISIFFFVLLNPVSAQKPAKSFTIVAEPFYYGLANSFSIQVSGVSPRKLVVVNALGATIPLEEKDGRYYPHLNSCSDGSCNGEYFIWVYEKTKKGRKILGPLNRFQVRSLPPPSLVIAGKLNPDALTLAEFSTIETFWLRAKIGKIDLRYKVLSYDITFTLRGDKIQGWSCFGSNLTDTVRTSTPNLKIGSKLYLDISYMLPDSSKKVIAFGIKVKK